MYFGTKSYLKNNHYYTVKHALNLIGFSLTNKANYIYFNDGCFRHYFKQAFFYHSCNPVKMKITIRIKIYFFTTAFYYTYMLCNKNNKCIYELNFINTVYSLVRNFIEKAHQDICLSM